METHPGSPPGSSLRLRLPPCGLWVHCGGSAPPCRPRKEHWQTFGTFFLGRPAGGARGLERGPGAERGSERRGGRVLWSSAAGSTAKGRRKGAKVHQQGVVINHLRASGRRPDIARRQRRFNECKRTKEPCGEREEELNTPY